MQRGRKLSYNAVSKMDGMLVVVHDIEFDSYDHLCRVKCCYKLSYIVSKNTGKGKTCKTLSKILLEGEETSFTYAPGGNCLDGKFECYAPLQDDIETYLPSDIHVIKGDL